MNKKDIIDTISHKTALSKGQIRQVVEEVLDEITLRLSRGEKCQFTGFGTFQIKKKASRKVIHPSTREKITVSARNIPVFIPGKRLLESVSSLEGDFFE